MNVFEKNFEQELETCREMVEAPGRKVLIVGVVSEGNGEGAATRAVSAKTTRKDGLVFVEGLRREADRLEKLLSKVKQ